MSEVSRWRPIFVLGIDRSGTSLVSELLSLWDAYAGEQERLTAGNAGNPRGYFEYGPMQEAVIELTKNVGVPVWHPDFKTLMKRQASIPELRRTLWEVAAEMEQPERPWFWKEPTLVFVLPFLTEVFPDAVYLTTLRNPTDSAVSYKRLFVPSVLSDKIEITVYFYLRWQYFMLTIFEELKSHRHHLVIPYEDLVQSPVQQCERICRFLAAEYPGMAEDPERAARMAGAVSPDLWRNNGKMPFTAAPAASEAQKELYEYARSRAAGGYADFDASRYPFPQFFQEYMGNMSALRWLLDNM